MRAFIDLLRANYDYVVLDTPPVGPVADSAVIASLADKTLFICVPGRTPRDIVGETVRQIAGDKKIAGVVLNFVNEKEARKYGQYAYSYRYGGRYYKSYYVD